MTRRFAIPYVLSVLTVALLTPSTRAEDAPAKIDAARYEKTVNLAIEYLRTKGQASDGSYSKQVGPAVTAICTTAILRHGRSPDDPVVARGLKYLEQFVQPDGGIYMPKTTYQNYDTTLAIVCFAAANKDGRYDKVIKGADRFIKEIQRDESEGVNPEDNDFGGGGYGKHKRPDLNNTAHLVEALRAAGNGADSEAMTKAMIFVSRCQNLETEHNQTPFSAKINDGGFYYTVAGGGSNPDVLPKTAGGALRSYGSMTYSGLKSMIYAGVGPDDPRVKAAFTWVKKNYDLETNPHLGTNGLFYYYHTFAKTLDAMGKEVVETPDGVKHHWRAELVGKLAAMQSDDGSFLNKNPRWLEGDPNLVTGYALLSLSYCRPPVEKK